MVCDFIKSAVFKYLYAMTQLTAEKYFEITPAQQLRKEFGYSCLKHTIKALWP